VDDSCAGRIVQRLPYFAAWSPHLKNADSFLSWEHAYANGPFVNPLHYARDNFTGNYTFNLDSKQALGLRFNGGRNDFNSSGQIPLDLVASGALDRFGYMDPATAARFAMEPAACTTGKI
jgi:hypothetical protein